MLVAIAICVNALQACNKVDIVLKVIQAMMHVCAIYVYMDARRTYEGQLLGVNDLNSPVFDF